MRTYTDFINIETGEVLATIDVFLDVECGEKDKHLATMIATYLVSFNNENFNSPVKVVACYDYGDGTFTQSTADFSNLLKIDELEEELDEEVDELDEELDEEVDELDEEKYQLLKTLLGL